MDIIFIKQLEVISSIGVYDWEKSVQQKLYFDLEMAFDNKPAASSDDIKLALNYFSVSEAVTKFAQTHQFELIETMAESVAALIMAEFAVPWVKVRLHKPGALPKAQSLGVQIERGVR
ncbi:dihydroneopterin aldolase [Psychromonas ingrahamii 37]|uniref:7,8-dihydroneopterin aldolase n=1 Tax=Psychromonas ingrahamii (strain DSM 17664 / CCUG 51855 / 37) TaxID=357804 RepID=A1SRC5_PSYIN|nr:dihydroneopterin aldolase [Psychromonas ingrahamii]ABM02040.1 dihydroneopterin aldolase [Psychromonas ingrahamii 37]